MLGVRLLGAAASDRCGGRIEYVILRGTDFAFDAELLLYVVADIMGQDVGLREVTGGAEAAFEVLVEADVDVDLLAAGAIERSGGGLGEAVG